MYKARNNYWSCSRFADFVRGEPKIGYGTGDEWKEWKEKVKSKSKLRYWLAEKGLDILQDIVYWPIDMLYSIKYFIVNKYIDQTHALVAHPKNIKPGDYRDFDTRIFYCLFDELVNFVEIEKAYANFRFDSAEMKNKKWWQAGRWRTRTYRDKDAGIEHLKWEMSLNDESFQEHAAKEIYELYTWYTEVFPNRPDAYDASGWSALCDDKRKRGIGFFETDPEEDPDETRRILDLSNKIEQEYEDEDTEMLIRLIKIRKSLWI